MAIAWKKSSPGRLKEIEGAREYLSRVRQSHPSGQLADALDEVEKELDEQERNLKGAKRVRAGV